MYKIDGLTTRQVSLLNVLWSIRTTGELEVWMSTLSLEDQIACSVLMEMLMIVQIDEEIDLGYSLDEADDVLQKIMS